MWVGVATAIQDMAPDDRRGEAASYFSVALYAGLAFGPALGEWLLDRSGFDAVWVVSGLVPLVASLLVLGPGRLGPAHAGARRCSDVHRARFPRRRVLHLGRPVRAQRHGRADHCAIARRHARGHAELPGDVGVRKGGHAEVGRGGQEDEGRNRQGDGSLSAFSADNSTHGKSPACCGRAVDFKGTSRFSGW